MMMMGYLTECGRRGPGCKCMGGECRAKVRKGATTPSFVREDVAKAIKNICLTPYVTPTWDQAWTRQR